MVYIVNTNNVQSINTHFTRLPQIDFESSACRSLDLISREILEWLKRGGTGAPMGVARDRVYLCSHLPSPLVLSSEYQCLPT